MTRPAGKKETMTTEQVREDGSMSEAGWDRIGDAGLARALGLMVRPEWLRERAVAIAILEALDYSPEDVEEALAGGEQLHDGAAMDFARL
jgi:hypothetical protein